MFPFASDTKAVLLTLFPCAGTLSSNALWLDQDKLKSSLVTGCYVIHSSHITSPTSGSSHGFSMMDGGKRCGKRMKSIEVEKQFFTKRCVGLLKIKTGNKPLEHLLLLAAKVPHTSWSLGFSPLPVFCVVFLLVAWKYVIRSPALVR